MEKKTSLFQFLRHLRHIFGFVWVVQPYFVLCLMFLQLLQGIFPVALAWVTKQIFDELSRVAEGDSSQFLNIFLSLLMLQVILGLSSSVVSQLNAYLNSELNRRLSLQTEEEVYRQMLRLKGMAYFENPKYHELFQMASHGLQVGTNQLVSTLTSLVQNLVTLLSFFGVILFLNPLMLGILLIANVPHLVQNLRFGQQRVVMKRNMTPGERMGFYFSRLLSSIYFAKEVRLFNIGNYFLEHLLNFKREVQQEQRQQEIREVRVGLGLNLLSTLVATIMLSFVIYQAYLGQISIGDVTLYIAALSSISGAVESIIHIIASVNEQILFFQHYDKFKTLKPDLPATEQTCSVPPLSIGIELRNLSFRYTDDSPYILEKINLFIPAGSCLALVGLNGSGKTTLVKLLTRLYDPTEGQVLWDGIDIREFDVDEYRKHIGAIFQDFVRYDLTARENIGLGDVDDIHELSLIQEAAIKTGMHNYIQSLPEQYESILSRWLAKNSGGTDLSGGQWQKIAISRMFMRNADFMILDEPTAALDAESEYEIFSQFASLVENRTSLLISHRFSTVRMADHIAVLENGTIIEYGSHDELRANGGTYDRLYTMQAENYT